MTTTPFKKKKKNNYIDDEKLYEAMAEHIYKYRAAKELGEEPPLISNYIGRSIKLIAENLASKGNFAGYTYREDMIQDGIETCLKYLHNFNPEKYKKPFTYFTTIINYAFLGRIDKEKKETYIKYKSMQNSAILNSLADMPEDEAEFAIPMMDMMDQDKMTALFDRYEKKSAPKEPKPKAKSGIENFMEDNIGEDSIIR